MKPKWTKRRPRKGLYFVRDSAYPKRWSIVRIYSDTGCCTHYANSGRIITSRQEWSGPIEPPK